MTLRSGGPDKDQPSIREQILADPGLILNDDEVVKALASVQNEELGKTVIDGRGLALNRLEQRFKQLETENRLLKEVLNENAEAMQRTHVAALKLLDAKDSEELAKLLRSELPEILRVKHLVLIGVLGANSPLDAILGRVAKPDVGTEVGKSYIDSVRDTPDRILLRKATPDFAKVYGEDSSPIESEALLPISLPEGGLIGVLAIGSTDPNSFHPNMSTELLELVRQVLAVTIARLAA